jgi:predicted dehydrogenase
MVLPTPPTEAGRMRKIRTAVLGLGYAGSMLHLPALASIPSATVVGACDVDPERRARIEQRWHVPVFADFDEMLARAEPEVVVIATPPQSHADVCLRSFAAGADVVCEKPFVATLEQADAVIEAAAAAGRCVAVNHEFREMPIFSAIRRAIAGSPGRDVVFAQMWQLLDLPPWAEPGWRGQLGQRTLYEAGVHLVDLLLVLFGEQPVSVSASVSTCGVRDEETDAIALATMEFSRGRLAQLVQNRLCKGEAQYLELRAETGDASWRASFGGRARLTAGLLRSLRPHLRIEYGIAGLAWKEVGQRRTLLARNPKHPEVVATRALLAKTLAAFESRTAPPVSAADGRAALEVIAACYQSAATGQRVALAGRGVGRRLAGGSRPVA